MSPTLPHALNAFKWKIHWYTSKDSSSDNESKKVTCVQGLHQEKNVPPLSSNTNPFNLLIRDLLKNIFDENCI